MTYHLRFKISQKFFIVKKHVLIIFIVIFDARRPPKVGFKFCSARNYPGRNLGSKTTIFRSHELDPSGVLPACKAQSDCKCKTIGQKPNFFI